MTQGFVATVLCSLTLSAAAHARPFDAPCTRVERSAAALLRHHEIGAQRMALASEPARPSLPVQRPSALRFAVAFFDRGSAGAGWRGLASAMVATTPPSLIDVASALGDVLLALRDEGPGSLAIAMTHVAGRVHTTWAVDHETSPVHTPNSVRIFGGGALYQVSATFAP